MSQVRPFRIVATPRYKRDARKYAKQNKALIPISDSARYRMLGNAVCVNVAEWIGKRLIEAIKG